MKDLLKYLIDTYMIHTDIFMSYYIYKYIYILYIYIYKYICIIYTVYYIRLIYAYNILKKVTVISGN